MHVYTESPVLVVGTTADYIDTLLKKESPGVLFLTDAIVRKRAGEPAPPPWQEVVADLSRVNNALEALQKHLAQWECTLSGITAFDCESLELTAVIAGALDLYYPSPEAIRYCRDKYLSKNLWFSSGVPCSRCMRVSSPADITVFFRRTGHACILKPVDGSGSELVFCSASPEEGKEHFEKIKCGLQVQRPERHDNNPPVIIEEKMKGVEYSGDFIIRNEQVTFIRLCRKVPAFYGPFGTILAYILTDPMQADIDETALSQHVLRACNALAINRALCMVDFFVDGKDIALLELTPRPGGDCIPLLLETACDFDILTAALKVARGHPVTDIPLSIPEPCIGLRIHAQKSGTLQRIDTDIVEKDPRVLRVQVLKGPGTRITVPPADYNSWLLGNIIFKPYTTAAPDIQCREILEKLSISIEE